MPPHTSYLSINVFYITHRSFQANFQKGGWVSYAACATDAAAARAEDIAANQRHSRRQDQWQQIWKSI